MNSDKGCKSARWTKGGITHGMEEIRSMRCHCWRYGTDYVSASSQCWQNHSILSISSIQSLTIFALFSGPSSHNHLTLSEREMAHNALIDMEMSFCGGKYEMPFENGIHIDCKLSWFSETFNHCPLGYIFNQKLPAMNLLLLLISSKFLRPNSLGSF